MKNRDLISILNEIHDKVGVMRGLVKSQDVNGHTLVLSGDILHGPLRDLQLCFLILLAYTKTFGDDFPEDNSDMQILLHQHISDEKNKIFELWDSISSNLHSSFPEWMKLIKSYKLYDYFTKENNTLLLKWANEKKLFQDEGCNHAQLLIDIVDKSSSELGLESNNKKLLVIGDNNYFYKKAFLGQLVYSSFMLCPEGNYLYNCCLLNTIFFHAHAKGFQVLRREKNSMEVFPFEEAKFDTIYSFVEMENAKVLDIRNIISHTNEGGWGVVFGQKQDALIDKVIFEENSFPLIADYLSRKLYVYKISEVKNSKIHSIQASIDEEDLTVNYRGVLNNFINLIKTKTCSSNYQELTKEDYLYAPLGDVGLEKIFRDQDQLDFVFRKVEDILRIKSNHNIPAKDILSDMIVDRLSDNPFNICLSPKYLLDSDVHKDIYSATIHGECFVLEKNALPYFVDVRLFNEHYRKIAEKLVWGADVPKKEALELECRIMKEPGILWDGSGGFLRINCSEEHPICYRYCEFYHDDFQPVCQTYINEIEISEEFDEDFIIYQFSKHSLNSHYILVAPTKEKQHEYYLKKKDEYRLKNADLIKEIREEDRKALSVDLHYLKHDAAQYLSSINSTAHNFIKMLEQGPLALNDSMGANYTVKDALDNIDKSVSHVTEFLMQMTLLTDALPKRKINISDLLENFVKGCLKRDYYKVNLSIAENMENVFCLLDDRINKVFANILSNAERHAFTDFNRSDYELHINAYRENDMIIITFANNGTPPDSTLTEEGFFTRGLHVGKTGHNGFGGSIIRDTINAQDGIVRLHLNKDKKYPFIIEIKLKIEND